MYSNTTISNGAYVSYGTAEKPNLAAGLTDGQFPVRVAATGYPGITVAGGTTATIRVAFPAGGSFDARGTIPPAPAHQGIGAGLYETTGRNASDNQQMMGIQAATGVSKYPANPAGMVGLSDPSRCSFYWGQKVAKVPIPYITDAPIGDLGEYSPGSPDEPELPPVEEPEDELPDNEKCNFSIKNPSTWLNGGMCAAVGLLGAIWKALGTLVSAVAGLADAILDGLKGILEWAFMPDEDSWRDTVSSIQGAWGETAPGEWIGAVSDWSLTAPGSQGCHGPSFDVMIHDTRVEGEPLEACSGKRAEIAGWCKAFLTVGIVIFGALACIRALGSGFAWSPGGGSA